MLGSFASLVGALGLFMAASVNAQEGPCGGTVYSTGNFIVTNYGADYTVLTMFGVNQNQDSEDYLLYCGDTSPQEQDLLDMGVSKNVKMFKVPVANVLVSGTFTSSYVELAGGQKNIGVLEDPKNIVSPCLQERFKNGSIVPLDSTIFNQYDSVNVGFRENKNPAQIKDVWVPMSVEVAPLLRVQYINAVALFFNSGSQALITYNTIIGTYNQLKLDMSRIPQANKMRIGWVKYDFVHQSWTLRNTEFTRGIIIDAGGIPFPLVGDGVGSNPDISPSDFKILMTNADIIIDQTEFPADGKGNYTSLFGRWRALAGFTGVDFVPRVLDLKKIYSLDNTVNLVGISDYQYRMPSRPDLLLRDVIAVQYPEYNKGYRTRFLNGNFQYGGAPDFTLGPDNCTITPMQYNSGDITTSTPDPSFTGLPTPPPPVVGGGIYGIGGPTQGDGTSGSGKSKTTTVVIAVVCVAAVLGAAFAFAFYKWSRRAKEDRFIELEEEMNNEIPLS
ncbi:hypothetical protein EC957_001563 [Mortierella hygrophila]|uniref:Uncharacterized protein n=1 Tax=Mortierella hygrophila TaxID=979708 RepID=A0A9P6K7I8_9FUNG|nr:hypothetical protein EC957_001563 [Mortierella hygrophila]